MGQSTAEAWAMAMFHPEELDEVQIVKVWAHLNNPLQSVQQTWLGHRDGIASDETWAWARASADAR